MPDPKDLIAPLFDKLCSSLKNLGPEAYASPIPTLHGASVGQHVRHILDMYICLSKGIQTGVVNYESRQRDPQMEVDPIHAISTMKQLLSEFLDHDLSLVVEGTYDANMDSLVRTGSTYHRELLYNFEHTVHHMALIRIGMDALGSMTLPEGFGIAPSTTKYRQACAQ